MLFTVPAATELLAAVLRCQRLAAYWSQHNPQEDVAPNVRRAIERLVDGDRDTARHVVDTLFGTADPPDEWWHSHLGICVARSWQPGGTVTQAEAARILGVSRSRVGQLVTAGTLARDSDGRLDRDSVLRRLVALHVPALGSCDHSYCRDEHGHSDGCLDVGYDEAAAWPGWW